MVKADGPEDPGDRCQRLQQEWVEAEFNRMAGLYSPGASVDTVKGALGPLWYATVQIAGTPVAALVDTGSSTTIMSFGLFQKIGTKANIRCISRT